MSYPFGTSFAKLFNEDAILMSIGILFHIRTSEKDTLPLNKLHFIDISHSAFLFQLCEKSGCYASVKLPLTYKWKIGNCHLLLCYCLYFFKVLRVNHHGKQMNHFNFVKKQRRGLNRYNVLSDSWRFMECQATPLEI